MTVPYLPRTNKGMFGFLTAWIVGFVVLFGAIAIGLWAFGVFTADVKGAGGAIKQKNSAVNRVQKQEQFEQIAADFTGYLAKIALAKDAVREATGIDKQLRRTELLGLQQTCVDAAQQFNAESRKYTSRDWKSAGLPASLDPKECS